MKQRQIKGSSDIREPKEITSSIIVTISNIELNEIKSKPDYISSWIE